MSDDSNDPLYHSRPVVKLLRELWTRTEQVAAEVRVASEHLRGSSHQRHEDVKAAAVWSSSPRQLT